jgi:hypothetical protein
MREIEFGAVAVVRRRVEFLALNASYASFADLNLSSAPLSLLTSG